MELRPGYKKTEVGVIPEDWDVRPLSSVVDPERGVRYGIVQPGQYDPDGRLLIRGQDYSSGWVDDSKMFRVGPIVEGRYRNARVKAGDLIITIVGASTGEIARIPDWLDGANLTQTTARVAVNNKVANPGFVFHVLQSSVGASNVAAFVKGGAQPGLNCGDVDKFLLPFPRLEPEQKAIAKALSDVDAFIAALSRLIDKKRDLRQGTMQRLLTGQSRLPGFTAPWRAKRLGELLRVRHGKGQKHVEAVDGRYPILASGGVIGWAREPLYDQPSVLIGRKGTIDQPQYMQTPFWSVDTLFYTEMFSGSQAKFLYYRFLLIDWRQYNEASGVPSLNARTIERIEISCPDETEQTAIARVLSDMDAELTALEDRLQKSQALKQAMMQALITGLVRLPIPRDVEPDAREPAHA
jgi:type I restriction enzyme S subunit